MQNFQRQHHHTFYLYRHLDGHRVASDTRFLWTNAHEPAFISIYCDNQSFRDSVKTTISSQLSAPQNTAQIDINKREAKG